MKISALLIEDEAPARNTIKSYLRKYFPDITVTREVDNEQDAVMTLNNEAYDLVFLDVQLKTGTGVDVLQQVNKEGMRIVFTTAYDDYALEAFQNKAFGYLLKPINPIDFKEIVNRVVKDIKFVETTAKKIKVPTKFGSSYVDLNTIVRCESDSNYTHLYCSDEKSYIISKTLKRVEQEVLNSTDFVRIHQSHLINIHFIDQTKVSYNTVGLKDGTTLPVSRSRRPVLLEVLKTSKLQ